MKFVATYKPQLIEYLQKYLVEKEQESSSVILTPPNPYQKIIQFITSGKMVRGSLCIATYQLFKQDLPLELVRVASSLELFHAALLMHDDIMDESLTRHGSKSIHEQYKEWGGEQQLRNSARFGESVAQCIGDIMFFWAFDMLSDERTPHAIKHSFSHVLATTGLAQMQDMYYAMTTEPTPLSAVINMYKHKTAHYTFSLPLYAGAVLGGAPQEMLQKFQSLGELLGIVFQLKDDELGLFGDPLIMGKPLGDDIMSAKKTPYYFYLFEKASLEEQKKLRTIFGNTQIGVDDIEYVQTICRSYKIDLLVEELIQDYARQAGELIKTLGLTEEQKKIYNELLEFSLSRKK